MRANQTITVFAAMLVSGCGPMPPSAGGIAAGGLTPATLGITDNAARALAQAESNVERARQAHALWTTAETALLRARDAAGQGDSVTVIKQAVYASEQAKGGLAQLSYPSTAP